jgi:hypothetical protein
VSAAELVADLNSQGISLVANDHKLTCRGKESTLTPELLESLKARKDELSLFWRGCAPASHQCRQRTSKVLSSLML